MLATSSVDKMVTLWDTSHDSGTPRVKLRKDMKVGKLFTLNFYPSSPWLLGCAGGGKEIAIWDMREDETVQKSFGGRAMAATATAMATTIPTEGETPQKAEDMTPIFDSVMASASDSKPSDDAEVEKKSPASSKKKKKKKKKAHRAGR